MKPPTEPWLTKKEIAKHFRVSAATIERTKPPSALVGGQRRYRITECERFYQQPPPELDEANNVIAFPPRGQGAA